MSQTDNTISFLLFMCGYIEMAIGLAIVGAWCFRLVFPFVMLHVEPDIVVGLLSFHGGIFLVSLEIIFEKLKFKEK